MLVKLHNASCAGSRALRDMGKFILLSVGLATLLGAATKPRRHSHNHLK